MNADNWPLRIDGTERVTWQGAEIAIPYCEYAPDLRAYDVRTLFPDDEAWIATVEKRGYAVHHDAGPLADADKNFNGTTLDESLDRLDIIWRDHREKGWNGIGYHRLIDPAGRVFLTGSSATHRAHAKGWDYTTGTTLNHTWLGVCFMGDWSGGRPPETAMRAFRAFLQWETNQRGVPMLLRPHKNLQPGTECPGGWAANDAWADVVLRPAAPPSSPQPAPAPRWGRTCRAPSRV